MRIAVFGMTADPMTVAHKAIIDKIIAEHLADKVVIFPTIVNYHRTGKTPWLTFDERIKVMKAFVGDNDKVEIFLDEIENYNSIPEMIRESYQRSHRYIHTLCDIVKKYNAETRGQNEYLTVIGSDEFKVFRTWFACDEILKLSHLIVVMGRNDSIDDLSQYDIEHYEIRIKDEFSCVSATKIREKYSELSVDSYIRDVVSGKTESTEENKVFYRCPIFKVVQLKEVAKGFKPTGIIAPDWVTVIVEKDGKFLMEKQLRYGLMKECIEFPCGQVEAGEEPKIAARRELREETGYVVSIDDVKDLGTFDANPAFMSNRMHYYYVNLDTADYQEGKTHFDEHEKIVSFWDDKAIVRERFRKERGSVFIAGALQALEWAGL